MENKAEWFENQKKELFEKLSGNSKKFMEYWNDLSIGAKGSYLAQKVEEHLKRIVYETGCESREEFENTVYAYMTIRKHYPREDQVAVTEQLLSDARKSFLNCMKPIGKPYDESVLLE
jgi:hypothetical protein